MNRYQKLVLSVGASVVLLMLMFPPFHVQIRDITHNMGYAFILEPPYRGAIAASVNVGVLLVQWLGVLLLTGLTFFTLKPSSELLKPSRAESASRATGPGLQEGATSVAGTYHPWRRLFARTVDLLTSGMLGLLFFVMVVAVLFPESVDILTNALENPLIGGVFLFLAWLPFEAAFIAMTGTTPAKWIFGISVSAAGGGKLSYALAFKRSSLVWIQGDALGIPFVAFFTRLFAYLRLTRTGTTLWDASVGSVVTHQKWDVGRATASVLAVIAAIMLLVILESMGNS